MIVIINIKTRPVKLCDSSQAEFSKEVAHLLDSMINIEHRFCKCSSLQGSLREERQVPHRNGKTHKVKVLEYLQSLTLPAIIDRDDISKAVKIAPKDCVSALGRLRKDGLISYSYADKFKAFVILGVSESNGVSESDNPLFDGACPWESPQTMS